MDFLVKGIFDMSLIPKFYMEAVVSIGVRIGNGINWIGTGFFVVKPLGEDIFQPLMITNRHVLMGNDNVVIRLKDQAGILRVLDMPLIVEGRELFSYHKELNIDIAAVLINGSYITENNLQFSAFNIEEHSLNSSDLVKQGGNEGSYVYMLGFPMGLVNVDSNTPICRGGCIARIDEKEIQMTKQFLLDIQNFPGNSGSPIITKPEMIGLGNEPVLGRSVLIGIVHGYIPYEEKLINAQTKKIVEVRSENSGIAVVNPVEYIKEVVEMEMDRQKNFTA